MTGSSTFTLFAWAGDQYVVPDAAVPYLGSTLDPRLFDVSYLARLREAYSSPPLVTITLSGSAAPGLTGLTITHRSGRTETAVLSWSQAERLGRLLAARWQSAAARRPGVTAGQLPGITRISLVRPPGGPVLPEALPRAQGRTPGQQRPTGTGPVFHTLTLDFTDRNGRPGTAVGWVQNLGDARLGEYFVGYPGQRGTVSFSVPAGTYSLQFSILTPAPSKNHPFGDFAALVVKPQVSVRSDETIHLDARTALPYKSTLAPPETTTARVDELFMDRTSQRGGGINTGAGFLLPVSALMGLISSPYTGQQVLSATPTPAVTRGIFGFNAASILTSQRRAPWTAARYYLDFPHAGGIPRSLTYTVPAADLTTVHTRIDASPSGNGPCGYHTPELWPYVYEKWGYPDSLGNFSDVLTGPRTDYWYTSSPRLDAWQVALNATDCTRRWDGARTISPGQQISETWNQAPLAPSPAAPPLLSNGLAGGTIAGRLRTACPACRQDDNGFVYLLPNGDSDPSHYAGYETYLALPSTLRFYRNGRLALASAVYPSQSLAPFSLDLPMLPADAAYRLDWRYGRLGDPAAYSDTSWGFRSARVSASGRPPAGEVCSPDLARACSFLPMLFITYDLALNTSSQAPAGAPFRIAFTVGHQQGEAPPARVSASVSASFDDGKTWTAPRAAHSLGGGRFTLTISQPPLSGTSGFASLRIRARDGDRSSVTQTIIRAYGLTS